MIPTNPIFIIGTSRSGSNLLRLMLNTHSRIFIPHSPHIFSYFADLESCYGDLTDQACLRALLRDVIRLLRAHIYPWDVPAHLEDHLFSMGPQNLVDVYAAVYNYYRQCNGKERWGCKSTLMIDHTQAVLQRFPLAKLIWLIRDPRDVAASSRQSVFNPCHPYLTAQLWHRHQTEGLRVLQRYGPTTVMPLYYERLIHDPVMTTKHLCDFLGEPFEDKMLEFFKTAEAHTTSSLSESWRNTALPILSNNDKKYSVILSKRETRIVESVNYDLMRRLGYQVEFKESCDTKVTILQTTFYRLCDSLLRFRLEMRSLMRDKNHWRRWRRNILIAYIRRQRQWKSRLLESMRWNRKVCFRARGGANEKVAGSYYSSRN